VQKVSETIKGRTLGEEYSNVKNSKQQSAFENFARQVALAISAVLKNNITLIEQITNTMEPNQNIQIVRSSV